MEIKVNIDDKLIEEVKDARSTLAKIKAAIDKARKAAAKWFSSEDLKLSDDAEKKINGAHLVYNQKIAEITNVVIESILGQKIDIAENPETENCRQIKKDGADADVEPNTLRELAKQQSAEQVNPNSPKYTEAILKNKLQPKIIDCCEALQLCNFKKRNQSVCEILRVFDDAMSNGLTAKQAIDVLNQLMSDQFQCKGIFDKYGYQSNLATFFDAIKSAFEQINQADASPRVSYGFISAINVFARERIDLFSIDLISAYIFCASGSAPEKTANALIWQYTETTPELCEKYIECFIQEANKLYQAACDDKNVELNQDKLARVKDLTLKGFKEKFKALKNLKNVASTDTETAQKDDFDFTDCSGVKGITGMSEDGEVREYITVNDVNIEPLDKVRAMTKEQANKIFLIPALVEKFMPLPAGVKRVALYLRYAYIVDTDYESVKSNAVAYIRAVKSIIDLPDSDWPGLPQAFEIVGAFSTPVSARAIMKDLSDLSQKDDAKRILNSICARQFAFVGESVHAIYDRLSAAVKHESEKLDLPDDLNDEPKETAPEPTKEEKKEPAADKIPEPVEELPEFLARVKQASTKEEINKLSGTARVATTGSEAKGLVFYGDPFITNKDYSLLQQALADREQELKKKEIKDFRFLRRAGDFKSSFAVRIAYDLYRRIKGDKDVKLDHLRDIAGLLSDDKEKTKLLAEINTYARNIGQGKEWP